MAEGRFDFIVWCLPTADLWSPSRTPTLAGVFFWRGLRRSVGPGIRAGAFSFAGRNGLGPALLPCYHFATQLPGTGNNEAGSSDRRGAECSNNYKPKL